MATHTQTFQSGMRQDVDAHLQPANTYRDSDNGRLIYNDDKSDAAMGHALAYMNAPGNIFKESVKPGYVIIWFTECSRGVLLFSTNNIDSEFGLWEWDSGDIEGTYSPLYNDGFDPNLKNNPFSLRRLGEMTQDRFGWKDSDSMDVEVTVENEKIERVYLTNRRSAVHTFNLNDAWNSTGFSHHENVINAGTVGPFFYPKHWSIHAFRERSDLVFPRIKFAGRGKGRLLSGVYQIAVKLRHKNGHESVFSPLTRRLMVTTNPLDDANASRQAGYRSNHHNRVMQPSGKMSGESLRFELEGIDQRWESYQIAVVYYQSPDKPLKRVALKPVQITSTTTIVDVTQIEGDELTDSAFNQIYDNVLRVGTMATNENRLITGDLRYLEPFSMDDQAVTFTPKLRTIDADQTAEPTFISKPNAVSNRNDNDPITNSVVTSTELNLSAFAGQAVRFTINQDYANYKGQLYDQMMKGYFRGETYEFGALCLDRSGMPMFVQPLPAFTFPEQYEAGPNGEQDYYSLTRYNAGTNRYELKIMGLTISGLALPVDKLYDQDGRLNVSGFKIVRRKRIGRIRHQGVVFPICKTKDCYVKANRDYVLFPLPTPDNGFKMQSVGDDQFTSVWGTPCKMENQETAYGPTTSFAYYLNYHSPDLLIEESLKAIDPGDELKYVGVVGQQKIGKGYTELVGKNAHVYTKSYKTETTAPRFKTLGQNGRPNLGETSRLAFGLQHTLGFDETYKEFDKDILKAKFETQTHPNFWRREYNNAPFEKVYQTDGLLQRNSVVFKTKDWKAVDISETEPNAGSASNWIGDGCSYRLVNYLQPTTTIAPEDAPYMSTGHYQPITEAILKQAKEKLDSQGNLTHYVFDDVEVWGGDCAVNLFDFTRIYPFWSDGCEKSHSEDKFPDYAVSHVVPIESKYNLALRWGRSFAANGTKPQATSCDSSNLQFVNGIMALQPEDWKYNAVLSLEEGIQFYNAKDPEQDIIVDRSDVFQWSPEKTLGQRLDAWRVRYVGDYGRVDGSLGPITKLVTGSFNNLYLFQSKGVGLAPLNASQYSTSESGVIVVGSGKVFSGMVYLTKEMGTQHPESVWVSKGQIGAWDARNGVLLRHSQAGLDELSKVENIHDQVQRLTLNLGASDLNTLKRWRAFAGVDSNGDVLTTFWYNNQPKKTIVYSPSIGAYTGSIPGMARLYGKRGRYMFSVDPFFPHKIYLHHGAKRGTYYEKTYPTVLRFIVNPAPTITKRFDNGFLNVNKVGSAQIAQIRQWTPNNPDNVQVILRGDERLEWRDNNLIYPMAEFSWTEEGEPLRDHYLIVEITIDNTADVPVELLSFTTAFLAV